MATGRIHEAYVYDHTAGKVHHSKDFPIAIPSGHLVKVIAGGENTSGETLVLKMTVELREPTTGAIRATQSWTASLDHGGIIWSGWTPTPVKLDKGGTWRITGRLDDMGVV